MFPKAIYFDTNSLLKAGEFLNRGEMPNLLGQARDFSIALHVVQLVLDERLLSLRESLLEKLCRARSDLTTVYRSMGQSGTARIDLPSEAELAKAVEDSYRARLQSAGITEVPTVCPSVDDLLSRALNKIPPFERGDKGFRDAIILDSIVAHATAEYRQGHVLVISSDAKFLEGAKLIGHGKLNLSGIDMTDAPGQLEQSLEAALKVIIEEEEQIALRLLQLNKDVIFENVKQRQVARSSIELGNSEFTHATIKCVQAVRPADIAWAQPRRYFSTEANVGDRIPVLFGVGLYFDLVISQSNTFLWNCGPGIPLEGETHLSPIGWQDFPEPQLIEKTVYHEINVHATARVDEGGELVDLHILSDDEVYNKYLEIPSQAQEGERDPVANPDCG